MASVYTAQLHVRERGTNNHGTAVARYLAYTGLPEGHPWCAAFVCWVYGQAGIPNPRSAWSPALFPASKIIWQQGKQNKLQPRQADVFGIWFADKRRIAHAGFVDRWGDKWVITVEGNTNAAGSRDGDGVYRKRRPVKSMYRVARWIN